MDRIVKGLLIPILLFSMLGCKPAALPPNALAAASVGNEKSSEDWWDTGWKMRNKLYFNTSNITGNLTDFPVLVHLTPSNFAFGYAKPDGGDLRFVDAGNTVLDYEVEKWSASDAWVWVKVPQLNGNPDNDFVWMYYSNGNATSGWSTNGVWDGNFKGIWHLDEAAGNVRDATFNSNNSTNRGAGMNQSGIIAGAYDFDTPDYVAIGATSPLNISGQGLTMEAWVKFDSAKGDNTILCKANGAVESPWKQYTLERAYGKLRLGFDNNGTFVSADSNSSVTAGSWQYYAGTYDGSNIRFYIGGQLDRTVAVSGNIAGHPDWKLNFGKVQYGGGNYQLDGMLDEVRISDTARSPDWMKASYLSGTDALITFGKTESLYHLHSGVNPYVNTSIAFAGSVVLGGNLTSLGSAGIVHVFFEFGTTDAYGNSTEPQPMTATGPFSSVITGLQPNTTYHYRSVMNAGNLGIFPGEDLTFSTSLGFKKPENK